MKNIISFKILFFMLFALCLSVNLTAQNEYLDSLYQIINTTNDHAEKYYNKVKVAEYYLHDDTELSDKILDTIIAEAGESEPMVLALNLKGEASYYLGNYSEELDYYIEAKRIAENLDYKLGLVYSLKNIGIYNIYEDNYFEAQKAYLEAIELAKEIGDTETLFSSYLNIGVVFDYLGDYQKALEYQQLALENALSRNDKENIASCYINISTIHRSLKNYALSEEYVLKTLPIELELNDLKGQSTCYNNLGNLFADTKRYEDALENYKKSLEIDRQLGDSVGVSICLTNIGMIYEYEEQYDKAFGYYNSGLEIMKLYEDLSGMSENFKNIGSIFIAQEKYKKGFEYLLKSWDLATEIEDYVLQQQISEILSKYYAKIGNFEEAYKFQVILKELSDTVFNNNNIMEITKMETSFEYERLLEIKELEKKQQEELTKAEAKRRKVVNLAFLFGFVFMLTIAFLSFRSYRLKRKAHAMELRQKEEIKQKNEELRQFNEELNATLELVSAQKEEIVKQHETVSLQQEEITKSIVYASRIQNAVLPPVKNLDIAFADYFVLFMPRSIVSGDFYWVNVDTDRVFWAAADCTGHGVPGAFMSMLGISLLTEIVKTNSRVNAAEVLGSLRSQIKTALRQTGKFDEQKDGMDIALAIFDKNTSSVNFSGAYSPLYIIRNNKNITDLDSEFVDIQNNKYSLLELSGDKQPVAVHIKEKEFANTYLQVYKSDIFYSFSDGYADQFGTENLEKFMLGKFKKMLLEINDLSMKEKKEKLEKTIIEWKGKNKQIDDILVFATKMKMD